jgi:RimJ/RimL family protein N-acetyltransferase
MSYILETKRLRLREFLISDSDFIILLLNSPGWLEFIGDRNVQTTEQAIAYIENGPLKSYLENGFGLSLVSLKSNEEAIGMCGLLKRPPLEHPDIGYALLPEHTGKGYATEITHAVMDHARHRLNLTAVCAITTPDNVASIKVMEKIGMKYSRIFQSSGDTRELMLFSSSALQV